MHKYRIAVLKNEADKNYSLWIKALEAYSDYFEFSVIDLTAHDWMRHCTSEKYDLFVLKPSGLSANFKQLFDERVYILNRELKLPVYPSLDELYIYENKRFFSYWLEANKLPHPATHVFYDEKEAGHFLKEAQYPVVAKSNTGASGSGVKILNNYTESGNYLKQVFSGSGAGRQWMPSLSKGSIIKRGMKYIIKPGNISGKAQVMKVKSKDIQRGFVIFQEFIPHDYEWRIVAIGDSYFAHKKLKSRDKASGSLLKNYDNPPLYLFDFARSIMERFGFFSQAIDVFETLNGELLINEMQCIFGQSDQYQMLVDGKPGRYRFINGVWKFEEGMFNENQCYNLRAEHILRLLQNGPVQSK